jgi:hypothetical protein
MAKDEYLVSVVKDRVRKSFDSLGEATTYVQQCYHVDDWKADDDGMDAKWMRFIDIQDKVHDKHILITLPERAWKMTQQIPNLQQD